MEHTETRKRGRLSFLPWLIPSMLFCGWIVVSQMEIVPRYLFPSPMDVLEVTRRYVWAEPGAAPFAGRFAGDLSASLGRVTGGFLLAVLLGTPLGILSGRLSAVDKLLNHVVNGLRAVPGITWLPLAMVWFGIGNIATVFLVALAAFFPVYLNAAAGARQIDPVLVNAGAMLGVKRLSGIFRILLPGAMPHIVTGLRLGLGISWAYLVLGELTGVPRGLGAAIMDARMLGRVDMIVVGMILIAVVGRISDRCLVGVLRLCFKSARRMA